MAFAIQIASNAVFYHTHKISGKTYSHAHPGCEGHSHSAADFAFYQQLQTILSEEAPQLLSAILPFYNDAILIEAKLHVDGRYTKKFNGRAPPAV